MLVHLLQPTSYHARIRVWKKNPYRDKEGQFTSKDKAVVGGGPAQALQARHAPPADADAILQRVLSNERERVQYQKAEDESNRLHNSGATTKRAHTKPGTGTYTPERLLLHRQIIDKLIGDIASKKPPAGIPPTLTMIGGRSGSGKGSFSKSESAEAIGLYEHRENVVLDPDVIKGMLPGYEPRLASVYHQESVDIFNKAVAYARKAKLNTVLDFTMSTGKLPLARSFKKQGFTVEAHYLHRPLELAVEAAIKRYQDPSKVLQLDGTVRHFPHGRVVPMKEVLKQTDNEKHFDDLRRVADVWTLYDNSKPEFNPVLVDSSDDRHLARKSNPYHDLFGRFSSKLKAMVGLGKKKSKVKHQVKHAPVDKWKPETVQEGRVLNGIPLKADPNPDFSQSVNPSLVEPPLSVPRGKHVSAGVVVTEPDGRVWVVQPKNRYGGYKNTFAKGTVKPGENMQETAAREVWEESGLVVKITGHLTDVERTTSVARFYRGERIGGAPWAAGHETHAVKLLPIKGKSTERALENVFNAPTSDRKVLEALRTRKRAIDFTTVLKHNPYRDKEGKFTDKAHAVAPGWYKSHGGHHVQVGEGGVIAGGTHQGKEAQAKHFAVGPFKTHEEAKAYALSSQEAATAKAFGIPTTPSVPKPVKGSPEHHSAYGKIVADAVLAGKSYEEAHDLAAHQVGELPPAKPPVVQSIAPTSAYTGPHALVPTPENIAKVKAIAESGKPVGFLEDQVAQHLAKGSSVTQIAMDLNLNLAQVYEHIGVIESKKTPVAQQVAANMAIANPNEYEGKDDLVGVQNSVVVQMKPLVGHAKVMGQEVTVNPKTGMVEVSYYHQFYDKTKALEAFTKLAEIHGSAMKVTELQLHSTLKGSRIYVKSVHKPKADPHPVVVSEKAKLPHETVPQPPKPLTAAQQTAKGKAQMAQQAKYTAQYEEQYVDRVIKSLDLKQIGQNSKAKSMLAPLTTIEKALVNYGMSPTDLKTLQEKVQAKVEEITEENFKNAVEKQVQALKLKLEYPNDHYSGPAYTAMIAADQAKTKHPGLLKKKGGTNSVNAQANVTVNVAKFAAMKELADAQGDVELEKIATAKALKLGLKDAVEAFHHGLHATDHEIRETLKKPIKTFSTVAEAEEQITDVGIAFHMLDAEYMPYNAPEAKVTEHKQRVAAARAKYDLARASYLQSGGTIAGVVQIVNKLKYAAQEKAYEIKNAVAIAKQKSQDTLTKAAYEVHKTNYDQGPNSEDYLNAVKTLDVAMTEAKGLMGEYDAKMFADIGKKKWDEKIADLKGYATEKITKAIYSYEFAVLHGLPAEKVAELKLQMDHAKTTDAKFFPAYEMDAIHDQQRSTAKAQKEVLDRLENLGAGIKAKLQHYDEFAVDFQYPTQNNLSKHGKFKTVQSNQITALTAAEKAYIEAYTGSSYKVLNRAAGKYGTSGVEPNFSEKANMEKMDSAMSKVTLGENVKLNRTMPQVYLAKAMGMTTLMDKTEAQLQELVGKVYTETAYSSTSMSESWGSAFSEASNQGVIGLKIRAGADVHGIRVINFTDNKSEQEVILARGTTYVIRSVKRVKQNYGADRIEMEVDVVAQLPKPLPGAKAQAPMMG